ncbi:MAG: hypothetical protein CMH28_07785 [Micavibrio sp.]|nr:hypothetical protein [Micavibrio sp.]|tara:strand:+ start:2279 stop:2881 length:603 start_codon:yes stop_codon:yes gene_type:complete
MRFYLTTITLLLLTACGGGFHTGFVTAQVNGALEKEWAGWDKVTAVREKDCPRGTEENPLLPSEVMQSFECWESAVQQYVMPVAVAPDILMSYLIDIEESVLNYKNGIIDRESHKLASKKLWSGYVSNVNAKVNSILNQANQIDMQAAQQQQQYFQNLSHQIQQQETMQARQCSSIDIAPMASLGCKNVCINGNWAEVCG